MSEAEAIDISNHIRPIADYAPVWQRAEALPPEPHRMRVMSIKDRERLAYVDRIMHERSTVTRALTRTNEKINRAELNAFYLTDERDKKRNKRELSRLRSQHKRQCARLRAVNRAARRIAR